jgi:hypothetical protein
MVAAAAPDGRDFAALRSEQLASNRVKASQKHLANLVRFSERHQVCEISSSHGGKYDVQNCLLMYCCVK